MLTQLAVRIPPGKTVSTRMLKGANSTLRVSAAASDDVDQYILAKFLLGFLPARAALEDAYGPRTD
jgi:hypothetical protein